MRSILGSPRGGRRLGRLAVAAVLVLAACGKGDSGSSPIDPIVPGEPTGNPRFRAAAFIFDVNTADKSVTVTAPSGGVINASRDGGINADGTPNYSILAGDVVQLSTANYQASAVGAFTPGKVRVTFDVFITNRISAINLITPTFPAPPAGVTGVLLFPFEAANIVSTGGATPGGDGTEIIVEQPSRGAVAPSVDFEGEPFNFFNDVGCAAGNSDDCYRYQAFGQPLLGGGTSEAQTVGFDIDPTVFRFRTRLIVAADIASSTGAAVGTITGTVLDQLGAPLAGVIIGVTGGLTATTDAAGAYSIGNVPVGPKTVSVTGGLGSCTLNAPLTQNPSVPAGGTVAANFTATCPIPTRTISGTVTRNGTPFSTTVTASTGGSDATDAAGLYTLQTAVGTAGTLSISGLGGGCTTASDLTYPAAGPATRDIAYTCPVPGPNSVTGTWTVNAAANTASLRIAVTVATGNVGSFTQEFRIPTGSGLTFVNATPAVAPDAAFSSCSSTAAPATTILVSCITDPGFTGTNVTVRTLNFTYTGTGLVSFIASDGVPLNAAANYELTIATDSFFADQLAQFANNVSIDQLNKQ